MIGGGRGGGAGRWRAPKGREAAFETGAKAQGREAVRAQKLFKQLLEPAQIHARAE